MAATSGFVLQFLNQQAKATDPNTPPVVSYAFDPATGWLTGKDAAGNEVIRNGTLGMVTQSGGTLYNVTNALPGTGLIYTQPNGQDNIFGNVDASTVSQLAAAVGVHVNVRNMTYTQYAQTRGANRLNLDAEFDKNGNLLPQGQHSYAPGVKAPDPTQHYDGGTSNWGRDPNTGQPIQATSGGFTPEGFTAGSQQPGSSGVADPNQPFGEGFGSDYGLNVTSDPNFAFGGGGQETINPGTPPATAQTQSAMQIGLAGRNVTQGVVGPVTPVSAANAQRVNFGVNPITATTAKAATATATPTAAGTTGTTGAPGTGTAPGGGQQNALADLQSVLDQYGLGSLTNWAWQQIQQGASESQVLLNMRNTPEFKARFPAIAARQQAGLPPISPADYVNYENQATQMLRAAGLPSGFWDSPADFTNLLTNDVSLSELQQRTNLATQAAYQVPSDVRAVLQRDYGVGAGQLAAFFLDPKTAEPLIARDFTAAQIGGAAYRTGYGSTRPEDEYLTDLGVNAQQAQQGFTQLTEQRQLFSSLPGENTTGISRDQQLQATFSGNAQDQEAITRRAQTRAAQFGGGGQFSAGQSGFSGIGEAQGA